MIGFLIAEVDDEDERKATLAKLGEQSLDWRRQNLEWESVIGVKNSEEQETPTGKIVKEWISPRASRQAIDGTIAFLKKRLGLSDQVDGDSVVEI